MAATWGRSREPFHVAGGETVRLPAELVPPGILRGRLLDGEGRPVPQARIEMAHIRGGSAAVATTDTEGRFELVSSGTFTLMACPAAKQAPPAKAAAAGERTAWVPTYFQRGTQRSEGQRIVVRPGAGQDGYEIRLRAVPVYRVRGVLLNEDGKPAPGVTIRLVTPDRWNQAILRSMRPSPREPLLHRHRPYRGTF